MEGNVNIEPKALIISDLEASQSVYKCLLESVDYTVVQAKSGIQALTLFEREHFDLILIDIKTQKLNGTDITDIIRKSSHKNNGIFIIDITENTNEYLQKAKNAGINIVLNKPIDINELKNIILALNHRRDRARFPKRITKEQLQT